MLQITGAQKQETQFKMQCQKPLAKFKLSDKLGGILFIKNCYAKQETLQKLKTLQQIGMTASSCGRVDLLVRHFLIFYFHFTFCILDKENKKIMNMNKPKFSLQKARKTVEISSKIEGHKIQSRKPTNQRKKARSKTKN